MILRAGLGLIVIALAVGIRPARAQSDEVLAWLECEECTEGQLDTLLDLAQQKRTKVVRELTSALMKGPSPSNRAALLEGLGRRYHRLWAFAVDYPDLRFPPDSLGYVRDYSTAYIALFQSRAAYGLARIGGSRHSTRTGLGGDGFHQPGCHGSHRTSTGQRPGPITQTPGPTGGGVPRADRSPRTAAPPAPSPARPAPPPPSLD